MINLAKHALATAITLCLMSLWPLAGSAQNSANTTPLTHQQALATVQPGSDLDAARTALRWWSSLLAQDHGTLASLSANPMMMEDKEMSLEALVEQFESPGIITDEADWPMALLGIDIIPVSAIPAHEPRPEFMPKDARVLPQDRIISLTMAEKRENGQLRRPITLHHYAQHLQASQYRIVGIGPQ